MQLMELCPQGYIDSTSCKKVMCKYRNQQGNCSIDLELEDREYEVGEIVQMLQISRMRTWSLYNSGLGKLKRLLADEGEDFNGQEV